MDVAIVGAGASGLCAARHFRAQNFKVQIFEQTGDIGGTWVYEESTLGSKEDGTPIHTSMYLDLKTNLPKELMAFEHFPYPSSIQRSFISQTEVLEYINAFAKAHSILDIVKLYEQVVHVEVLPNKKWLITLRNVKSKQTHKHACDIVIICSGHYNCPIIPSILGLDKFSGIVIHSRNFRTKTAYKNQNVFIIGYGPSGKDISHHISDVANKIYVSHRQYLKMNAFKNILHVAPVDFITPTQIVLVDGTTVTDVQSIILCTGYRFSFPFLDTNCGITVEDKFVFPLFKHMVNVNHPKMAFIGLPSQICPFPLFDLQVRFYLEFLKQLHRFTQQYMLDDIQQYIRIKMDAGIKKENMFILGLEQENYSTDLADLLPIQKLPNVIHNLYRCVRQDRNLNRNFKIINDEEFIEI